MPGQIAQKYCSANQQIDRTHPRIESGASRGPENLSPDQNMV
jgi:hypothetical protein